MIEKDQKNGKRSPLNTTLLILISISILGGIAIFYGYWYYIGFSKTVMDDTHILKPKEILLMGFVNDNNCIHYDIKSIDDTPLIILVMDNKNYLKLEDDEEFYYYTSNSEIGAWFAKSQFKADKEYNLVIINPTSHTTTVKIKVWASSSTRHCDPPNYLKKATLKSLMGTS